MRRSSYVCPLCYDNIPSGYWTCPDCNLFIESIKLPSEILSSPNQSNHNRIMVNRMLDRVRMTRTEVKVILAFGRMA